LEGESEQPFERCDARQSSDRGIVLSVGKAGVSDLVYYTHMTLHQGSLAREDFVDIVTPIRRRANAVPSHDGAYNGTILNLHAPG
jgi:hypothetical protein